MLKYFLALKIYPEDKQFVISVLKKDYINMFCVKLLFICQDSISPRT